MKKHLALVLCLVLLLPLLLTGCSKEVNVTAGTMTNVSFTGSHTGKTGQNYTATLSPSEYFEVLPENIVITNDGSPLTTGWSYDATTGVLSIDGKSITGDVAIAVTATHKTLVVDTAGLTDVAMDATSAKALEDFTATLTCDVENMEIDPASVSVSVGGTALADGWSFDPATGVLTVPGASVTGDIAVSAGTRESIVGVWVGSIDMADALNEIMVANDLGDYMVFSGVVLDLTMTFTADGVCTMEVDPDSAEAAMDTLYDQMKSGMIKMLEDLLEAYEIDMTVEDYLAASGYTIDSLMEDSLGDTLTVDTLLDIGSDGYYTVDGSLLYLSTKQNDEMDEEEANPFTIVDGVLSISVSEEDSGDYTDMIFPLVLTRAE